MQKAKHMASYLGIPMPERVAEAFQARSPSGNGASQAAWRTPSGPLLYALAKSLRSQTLLVVDDSEGAVMLWLALAAQGQGKLYLTSADGGIAPEAYLETLRAAGLEGALASHPPDNSYNIIVLATGAASASTWEWLAPQLAPDAVLVAADSSSLQDTLAEEARWRQVVTESGLLIAGRAARPPPYPESPRERFTALLLNAMQPQNLALGPNVVFDGSVKPPNTKVNFSGTGGQIGAGDLLLVHPEDLNRYSPLPGAVALVFGPIEEPIRAPHVAFTLNDEVLSLVFA